MFQHAYGNVQMPCQMILQIGFHKRQSGDCFFIFHTGEDLNNGQLNKVHEFRETKN
jgi:hypothetical protein